MAQPVRTGGSGAPPTRSVGESLVIAGWASFELLQLAEQLVVLGVRDGRIVEDVVGVVMAGEFGAQRAKRSPPAEWLWSLAFLRRRGGGRVSSRPEFRSCPSRRRTPTWSRSRPACRRAAAGRSRRPRCARDGWPATGRRKHRAVTVAGGRYQRNVQQQRQARGGLVAAAGIGRDGKQRAAVAVGMTSGRPGAGRNPAVSAANSVLICHGARLDCTFTLSARRPATNWCRRRIARKRDISGTSHSASSSSATWRRRLTNSEYSISLSADVRLASCMPACSIV